MKNLIINISRKKTLTVFITVLAFVVIALGMHSAKAYACSYPATDCGYFTGSSYPSSGDKVFQCGIPTDITTVDEFTTAVDNWAYGNDIPYGISETGNPEDLSTPVAAPQTPPCLNFYSTQTQLTNEYEAGARFIILTMDNVTNGNGVYNTDFPAQPPTAHYISQFNTTMSYFANPTAQGVPASDFYVQFGTNLNALTGDQNSGIYGQNPQTIADQLGEDNTAYEDSTSPDVMHIAYADVDPSTPLIYFHEIVDGQSYEYYIKIDCGNPVGDLNLPQQPPCQYNPAIPADSDQCIIIANAKCTSNNTSAVITGDAYFPSGVNYVTVTVSGNSWNDSQNNSPGDSSPFPFTFNATGHVASGGTTFQLTEIDNIYHYNVSISCAGSGGGGPSACTTQFGQQGTVGPQNTTITATYPTYTKVGARWVATTGSTSVTGTLSSANITANYQDGSPPASVPVSMPAGTFDAGAYYGFQTVTFSGTATYTGRYSVSATGSSGQPVTESGTASQTTNPTITPNTIQPVICGTLSCTMNLYPASGEFGTGRDYETKVQISYARGSNSSDNIAEYGGRPYGNPANDDFAVWSNGPFSGLDTDGYVTDNATDNVLPPTVLAQEPNTPTGETMTDNVGGTSVTFDSTIVNGQYPAATAAGYEIYGNLTGPNNSPPAMTPTSISVSPCQTAVQVLNQPYTQVNGSDVIAGAGFESSTTSTCNLNPSASIYGWNANDGSTEPPTTDYNNGSGTTLGALALGVVNGFVSGQGASPLSAPDTATFSNVAGVVDVAAGQDGGGAGWAPCQLDYWDDHPANYTTGFNPGTLGSTGGVVYANEPSGLVIGQTTITKSVVLFVNGNVFINGDIQYGSQPTSGAVTGLPSLIIVTNGNIYIAPNVGEVDGIYIAQGTSGNNNTGYIADCTNTQNDDPPVFAGVSACSNNSLLIRGSFVAAHSVYLWRTAGTVGSGNTNDPVDSAVQEEPAQKFDYRPAEWLAPSPLFISTSNQSPVYDSISSLPPVL